MRSRFLTLVAFCALLNVSSMVLAAIPVNLHHEPAMILQNLVSTKTSIQRISSDSFAGIQHLRLQQVYSGFPIYGADAVVHIPAGESLDEKSFQTIKTSKIKMNGVFYRELERDLQNTPQYIFSKTQSEKAKQQIISLYQKQFGSQVVLSDVAVKLLVYLDDNRGAHWGFLISFLAQDNNHVTKPSYIVNAITLLVDRHWNDLNTHELTEGGGYGGNQKTGKLIYDALQHHAPKLLIQRDAQAKTCFLKNTEVTVRDVSHEKAIVNFPCPALSSEHNNVYWDASLDSTNGAYSPSNDALAIGRIVKDMYRKWYDLPALVDRNGNPMMLNMMVHAKMENAYWNGREMVFGDGGAGFYPLVSLDVGAHEISHGFTQQHSDLAYYGQSGALNESFSDMAGQAAQFYATGHNDWQVGNEITKDKYSPLRYMDEPTKDCRGRPGENCSISHVKDYHSDLDVHYGSGVFNRVFFLISTTEGWDTKKAFDIMVHANRHYWTSAETFLSAACGLLWSAEDYHYPTIPIKAALQKVGLNTLSCN